ncbi:MAG: hypothetical protein EZS28_010037 [Streblomastix strix]|uniref:TmcB/TmcC TPR repeats domain-containing protein n=1 Tax=Streblomastix strix TaxID=222440 RepID=A0A5J4WH90_9EUKA|nr:MAG: hypothetical protein EZS28_010037 [Streblomastix strix]
MIMWIIQLLQFLAIGLYAVSFGDASIVNKIAGVIDFSFFVGLFKQGFIVFNSIAIFLFLLAITSILILGLALKSILNSSPWIRDVYRTAMHLFIPSQAILFSSIHCVNPESISSLFASNEGEDQDQTTGQDQVQSVIKVLYVNNSVQCGSQIHIIFAVFSIIVFVGLAIIDIVYRFFIHKHDPKHGGYDSHLNGEFDAVVSFYTSMQIIVMRVSSFDRGWRTWLTILPSSFLLIGIIFYQPYYHLLKNRWEALKISIYIGLRTGGELIVLCIIVDYLVKIRCRQMLLLSCQGHPLTWGENDEIEYLDEESIKDKEQDQKEDNSTNDKQNQPGVKNATRVLDTINSVDNLEQSQSITENEESENLESQSLNSQGTFQDSLTNFDDLDSSSNSSSDFDENASDQNESETDEKEEDDDEEEMEDEDSMQYIPKRISPNFIEQSVRFIYIKKVRCQILLDYVDLIYKHAIQENPGKFRLVAHYSIFLKAYKHQFNFSNALMKMLRNNNAGIYLHFLCHAHFLSDVEDQNAIKIKAMNQNQLLVIQERVETERSIESLLQYSAQEAASKKQKNAATSTRSWMKEFWSNMLKQETNYAAIPVLLTRIIESERLARKMYEELLAQHPNNICLSILSREIYREDAVADILDQRAAQLEDQLGLKKSETGKEQEQDQQQKDNNKDKDANQDQENQKEKKKKRSQQIAIMKKRSDDHHTMQIIDRIQRNLSQEGESSGLTNKQTQSNGKGGKKKINEGQRSEQQKQEGDSGFISTGDQTDDNKALNGQQDTNGPLSVLLDFIPTEIILHFAIIISDIALYILLQYFMSLAMQDANNIISVNNLAAEVGQLAVFSKYLLIQTHQLYEQERNNGSIPDYFPSEFDIRNNLTKISRDLIQKLHTIYSIDHFAPWEVTDCQLLYVSCLDGEVKEQWVVKKSLYDAMRGMAYAANDVGLGRVRGTGSEDETKSKGDEIYKISDDKLQANLAMIILNFPTTLKESVKRAIREYKTGTDKQIQNANILLYILSLMFTVIFTLINAISIIYRFVQAAIGRKKVMEQLLDATQDQIMNLQIELHRTEIQFDDLEKQREQEALAIVKQEKLAMLQKQQMDEKSRASKFDNC